MSQLFGQVCTSGALGSEFLKNSLSYEVDSEGGVAVLQSDELANASVAQPKVAILLCTHQGQRFLTEQLDSFENQTHTNWEVWASDDASDDKTHQILCEFKARCEDGRISIHDGPTKGFVANFLSLTCKTGISANYFAYADQDDIWTAEKLERAIRWLKTVPESIPALYCTRTELIDAQGRHIGFSPLFSKLPSFKNAIMQNIGGGNTMVFNNAARNLVIMAGDQVSVVMHDWWVYQLVSGAGGQVYYDPYPSVRYRQHSNNLVGMNASWSARFKRICMLWQGRFRDWNDRNISELEKLEDILSPQSKATLELFAKARQKPLFSRLYQLHQSGIYRQTLLGNLGLIVAAVFKKL